MNSRIFHCCVPECGRNSYSHPNVEYHPFPKEEKSHLYVTDETGIETKMEQKEVWELILLLKKPAHPTDRVCSTHFQSSDYYKAHNSTVENLSPTAIPTMELPQRTPTKDMCMVEFCRHLNIEHPYKRFFTLNRPSSDMQAERWKMWRKVMWNNQEQAPNPWVPLTVCADHFIGGEPSSHPSSIDYIPSRNLPRFRFEEVNVNESYSVMWDTTNQDPLELPEPDFVPVEEGLENEIKIEIDEIELDYTSDHDDHSYC